MMFDDPCCCCLLAVIDSSLGNGRLFVAEGDENLLGMGRFVIVICDRYTFLIIYII